MVKLNVDAQVAGGVYAGLGAVIRDENGLIVLTATKRMRITDVVNLDAMAIRFGMNVALRFNYKCIWVESDSLSAINSVQSKTLGRTPFYLVIVDIIKLRALFNICNFSHVRRNGNTVAHLVARGDTGSDSELICLNSFPQSIVTLANLDLV
ncbi:uncharacterized protein LOC110697346 [Chenopodium quinoa]|uniref:uncharacterized protein LOC110697346 n=1 Tax=Chenopodium quinoa TaxID=63459 RepID=UPI000B76EF41|nr:uncharacterized protein LOC110697346 [Chenopodium quinoa]